MAATNEDRGAAMADEEAVERLKRDVVEWNAWRSSHRLPADLDLSDADLNDTDLSGANLSGANLFSANLRGANLHGALIGTDYFRLQTCATQTWATHT
jgi:hypothetical protein